MTINPVEANLGTESPEPCFEFNNSLGHYKVEINQEALKLLCNEMGVDPVATIHLALPQKVPKLLSPDWIFGLADPLNKIVWINTKRITEFYAWSYQEIEHQFAEFGILGYQRTIAETLTHELAHCSKEAQRIYMPFTVPSLAMINLMVGTLGLVSLVVDTDLLTKHTWLVLMYQLQQLLSLACLSLYWKNQAFFQFVYRTDAEEKFCNQQAKDPRLLQMARRVVEIHSVNTEAVNTPETFDKSHHALL